MFFPLRSNLPTSPFTAAHHASRLALTLVASLLLAACGSSTPTPATPTPTPLLAPDLSVVNPQPYTQDTAITPLVFDNTGGDVTDGTAGCAVATNSALPAGLNVEVVTVDGKRTCRLTGTPMEVVSAGQMVTIIATNTAGSDSVPFSIIVNPAAPDLRALGAQSYSTGAPVNVKLDNDGGGELTECGFDRNNPLPNGLDVKRNATNDSCVITGIPDTATVATDYDITATNITGSDSVTVSIAVISGIASFAPPGVLVYAVGDNVNESFPNTSTMGGRVSVCVVPTGGMLPAGLIINATTPPAPGNGCTLTGSPTAITAQANYTINANNDNGSASLTLNITVNPAAPDLQAPDLVERSYPTGAQVSLVLTNDGGDVAASDGCDVDTSDGKPELPAGLRVEVASDANDNNKRTCRIFGTPTAVTPAADYVITATNITNTTNDIEPSSVTVNIAVPSGVASFKDPGALVYVVGEVVNQSFTNTNTDGSRVSACVAPTGGTLPAGLMIDVTTFPAPGNGCTLTGSPTDVTAQSSYIITVTNGNGEAPLTLDITVNPIAPKLSGVNAQVYAANIDIDALVFTNTGGDVTDGITGCAVAPVLPARLSVTVVTSPAGKRTCRITGNPTTPVATTDYKITATNVTGRSSIIVSITVSSGIVPDSLSGQTLFRYEAGRTVPETREITFTNFSGDAITSCTGPDLPTGMSIDSVCAISGAPSRITAQTTPHTITAMYPNGATSTATISIETYLSAPPSLSDYSGVTLADETLAGVTLVVGSTVGLPIVLENTGGPVGENGCQVASDNALGERPLSNFGLEVAVTSDSSSCEIKAVNTAPTGVPVEGETGYRITATNDLGVSGATAILTIIGASQAVAAPILTAPIPSSFTFPTNTAITPIEFTISGGGLGICTISQALPDGLRFDPSTCQISGTPRTASAMTTYTVTATNKTSPAATADVAITVTDAAPALESMVTLNLTMNSNLGLPFAIANTGGSPTSCTAAPTTASDDALGSYNLTTFDAGGTCVIDSLDGNGPSRTLSEGSFTITPSSGAASTLTLNLRSPATPQISAGNDRTYSINSTRQLFGWGNNTVANRLGLGDLGDFLPVVLEPTLLTGNDWAQVNTGRGHTCAINTSGQLFCWGFGNSGQLGLGGNSSVGAPMQVGSDSNWMQVSAGRSYTCAIKAAGEMWCWGDGDNGRLGLGDETDTNTPMQVGGASGASDWAQVSTGQGHTCAIKTSGQLWCWGWAIFGQLGLGDETDTNTPMQVGGASGASNWTQVSAGDFHICAINTSGELFCWGAGLHGRLGLGVNDDDGNGRSDDENTPTQVGSDNDWTQVSAGNNHTCAIKAAGELWCWGPGPHGELGLGVNDEDGDGDIDHISTPMQVGGTDGPSDWMQIDAGDEHTCAINTSGQPWCWGRGHQGQLGLGSYTRMSTPALVPDFLLQ